MSARGAFRGGFRALATERCNFLRRDEIQLSGNIRHDGTRTSCHLLQLLFVSFFSVFFCHAPRQEQSAATFMCNTARVLNSSEEEMFPPSLSDFQS